jgi:hypothetical protein
MEERSNNFARDRVSGPPLNLFLLDTARRDRQAAGGRTYSHLVDGFGCIFTTCLSLKLKRRHGRMDSATRSSRRCQCDSQKYPHPLNGCPICCRFCQRVCALSPLTLASDVMPAGVSRSSASALNALALSKPPEGIHREGGKEVDIPPKRRDRLVAQKIAAKD